MTSHWIFAASLFVLPIGLHATTEWFGDLRAHLNPDKAFYDVIYDDSVCPMGLQSVAIPEFVYFGEMVATKSAMKDHGACLQLCLDNIRCKAVNFFEPLSKKEMGFCELLSESQYDNPRLLRPFRKATYYEMIRCLTLEDLESADRHGKVAKNPPPTPSRPALSDILMPVSSSSSATPSTQMAESSPSQGRFKDERTEEGSSTLPTSNHTTFNKQPQESMFKKLMAKIQEFNARFGNKS